MADRKSKGPFDRLVGRRRLRNGITGFRLATRIVEPEILPRVIRQSTPEETDLPSS